MQRETVQVWSPDKERIKDIAEEEGVIQADVIAEAMEAYTGEKHHHRCPECDDLFTMEEVDPSTVREKGLITSDVRYLIRGKAQVRDFECPCCEARITPDDAAVDSLASVDKGSEESE